jgi:hypothetical protein
MTFQNPLAGPSKFRLAGPLLTAPGGVYLHQKVDLYDAMQAPSPHKRSDFTDSATLVTAPNPARSLLQTRLVRTQIAPGPTAFSPRHSPTIALLFTT